VAGDTAAVAEVEVWVDIEVPTVKEVAVEVESDIGFPTVLMVVADTVAGMKMEVEVEVGVEVGKFEWAVMKLVGFGEGTLIAG
jgi:chemotaxis protein CheY-P-specific phosphatase CheC